MYILERCARKAVVIAAVISSCILYLGCDRALNENNNSANNTVNANVASTPQQLSYTDWNLSREEYEKNREFFEEGARRISTGVGPGKEDGWVWISASGRLQSDEELRQLPIEIQVENGVVSLIGTVFSNEQKAKASQLVKGIQGVEAVNNNLQVESSRRSPAADPNLPSPTPVATEGLDIDREVSRMKEGDALSEVPTLMTLGETRTVTLILSPDSPTTKVVEEEQRQSLSNRNQEAPKRDLERKTRIETEKAYYSRFMEAKLSGQGFEIKAITPERQPVSNYQPTKWSWDVKATARGDQYLYLALNAIFEGEGSEKTRSVNTYSKAVRVEVSWGKFLADNWVTIVGVVIVPLTIAGLIPLLRWLAPNLWKSIRKDSAKRVEGFFRKR